MTITSCFFFFFLTFFYKAQKVARSADSPTPTVDVLCIIIHKIELVYHIKLPSSYIEVFCYGVTKCEKAQVNSFTRPINLV